MEKPKILIVDDSAINRTLLSDILKEQYNITTVENGAEAITLLSQQDPAFSLLLLDIAMPEMDGFEVLTRIKNHCWNDTFAVIMISSDDPPVNMKRAYDLGAFDYISKPFDPPTVQRRISNALLLHARQKHLEENVVKAFYEQEKNNKLAISILSHMVEFRNGDSVQHALHVNIITELLLKQIVRQTDRYPLSPSDITLISTASSLHDIGKISIPDFILNKPGHLTEEEFEIIKTHSIIGAQMLMSLPAKYKEEPLIQVASEICRWHHERYDGNGYPDGLKGEEIPIAAQAVALADVYDTLTNERCYKKAYTHDEAVRMISEGQYGAFNPILLQCLKEISDTLENDFPFGLEPENIQDVCRNIGYNYEQSCENHNFLTHKQQPLYLLYIDSLTGVYNRRYYDEYFQNTGGVQAVVMLDVDDFKDINDHYGHDAGDLVLRSIATTILSHVRKTDIVIRYGGDEFVIIFKNIPAEVFRKKLESIRQSVNTLMIDEYPDIHMSVSIGGVYGTGKVKELFKTADSVMYQSKAVKNRVTVCFQDEKTNDI